MVRSILISILLSALTVGSLGCTWVALTPEASRVQIGSQDGIDGCRQVGTTKSRTKPKIGIFARSDEKVAEELSTLARNDAPELNGNTVVAEGPVSADGMQRFAIYDCPTSPSTSP